jgi:hypothetical protein
MTASAPMSAIASRNAVIGFIRQNGIAALTVQKSWGLRDVSDLAGGPATPVDFDVVLEEAHQELKYSLRAILNQKL